MRERHVEDVGDSTGADDVVVVEEVTAFLVGVDRHVLFYAGEGTAAGDGAEEGTECGGVECIAEFEEVGEEGDLFFREVVQRGEIACLVYLPHSHANEMVTRSKSDILVSGDQASKNAPYKYPSPSP